MKCVLFAAPALTLLLTSGIPRAEAARCSDFAYQEDAQAFYSQNRDRQLDRDGDGVACEALPSRGSAEPTSDETTVTQCPAFVPEVDPWKLQKPVLLGNAKASYYYKGVILAGESRYVSAFLNCYNLTVKFRSDYSSAYPIWGAFNEVTGAGQSQTVCVAIDADGREADERIFSGEYADRVAQSVYDLK